jgi:hypothetical protein
MCVLNSTHGTPHRQKQCHRPHPAFRLPLQPAAAHHVGKYKNEARLPVGRAGCCASAWVRLRGRVES